MASTAQARTASAGPPRGPFACSTGELGVERDGQPPVRWFLDGQFVATSAKVLDERTNGYTGARSVTTSTGVALVMPMASASSGVNRCTQR
jgi:hypothetical protein